MNKHLLTHALTKLLAGITLIGLLVFLPAGSLSYWQGWLLICILFLPMSIAGIFMLLKSPELLRKRLSAKEKENKQKVVVALSGLLFIASFISAGLNWRFNWWLSPDWAVWTAAAVFILSYISYAEVLRENEYLSRIIEVQDGQKVIDTGLYGIVRHPMYFATIIMFLSMPIVLGSPISLIIMLGYIPLIAKRILDEERVLTSSLDGYKDYKMRVKYRLIPFIW